MINIIENIWKMCRTQIGSAMMKFEDVEICLAVLCVLNMIRVS